MKLIFARETIIYESIRSTASHVFDPLILIQQAMNA